MIYIVKVNEEFKRYISNLLNVMNGDSLIFSLIQENRDLEVYLDIADEIIYDNSDYLNGIVDLDQSIIEINEVIDIVPSSYRMKVEEYDFQNILSELQHHEYNNIFILIDGRLNLINLNEKDIIYAVTSEEKN